jgi:hypothetical protein
LAAVVFWFGDVTIDQPGPELVSIAAAARGAMLRWVPFASAEYKLRDDFDPAVAFFDGVAAKATITREIALKQKTKASKKRGLKIPNLKAVLFFMGL